jgi:hypothetical protein
MVAAIILFSIAFIIFILGIVLWIVKSDPIFMLFLTISIPFCICGAVCLYPTPKKSDIENVVIKNREYKL